MNKIICKRLEIILSSNVDGIFKDKTFLKKNREFISLPVEKIEYSGQSSSSDAGNVLNETVTAKIRYAENLLFLNTALKNYVLRLHTDNTSFYVGSPDYPAVLAYNSNKIYVNLTFKAVKPL
jgi:hypothetical protein